MDDPAALNTALAGVDLVLNAARPVPHRNPALAYRVRVRRCDGDYLVEQQAYDSTDGAHITWMRVLCSGYQAIQDDRPAAC